jgi:hypothetical protein
MMPALPPKADIPRRDFHVRYGPISDIGNLFGNLFDHLVGAGEQRLRDGEFEYQIRSLTELDERVVRESQLRSNPGGNRLG